MMRKALNDIAQRSEALLWPFETNIFFESDALPLLRQLQGKLDLLPLDTLPSPASLGRLLGARIVIASLHPPRQGWTWFSCSPPLIQIADWLPLDFRQLVTSHEVCHLILGPISPPHDPIVERVCNWGAGYILQKIGRGFLRFGSSTTIFRRKADLFFLFGFR